MPDLPPHVAALARHQDGVVSRRQLVDLGVGDGDIRSWRRSRLLTAAHVGVYLTHTGVATRAQRRRAAVLYAAPAALWGPDALPDLRSLRGTGDPPVVHVAVDERRRVRPAPGLAVHRVVDLGSMALWNVSVPRLRVEQAALDVAASTRHELTAVAVLTELVSGRHTTAERLSASLGARTRLARRALLAAVLDDVAAGACSVLERLYLRDVERAHGLPSASRQVRASARGTVYRDVLYARYGVVVELDGRLDHTDAAAWARDLERDLEAAADGLVTLRLGYAQSAARACSTAVAVGRVLQRHGWDGQVTRCARCR